ncbi:MAG: hypothetical protein LBI08_01860 [Methanomassiliicoccaceae archaeon]|jgi:hypothetical protein|nr:hypothetical protein [Methanomassiliicoccaceae archaeon]
MRSSKKITVLAVLLAMILPLSAAAFTEDTAAAAPYVPLKGNGTAFDPYIVSSAEDLRRISETYIYHQGAYYKQTADIVFNDADAGYKVFMDVQMSGGKVTVSLATNASTGIKGECAEVWFNGTAAATAWNDGFGDTEFDAHLMTDKNSVVAAGSINKKDFAVAVSFSDIGDGISSASPFYGNFTPIGMRDRPFSGHYDGNGFSITGMKAVSVSSTEAAAGMFGHTDSATVVNTKILSGPGNASYFLASVTDDAAGTMSEPVDLTAFSGSIVGHGTVRSSLIACHSDATVFSNMHSERSHSGNRLPPHVSMASYAGGLAGFGTGIIRDCGNAGNVVSMFRSHLSYDVQGDILYSDTVRTFRIDVHAGNHAGGLAGYSDNAVISASWNSGNIFAAGDIGVSISVAGYQYHDTVLNVTEDLVSAAGGIIGSLAGGTMADVYNEGMISSSGTVSSRIANNDAHPTVKDDVSVTLSASAGGIAGLLSGTSSLERAHNMGDIISSGGTEMYMGPNKPVLKEGEAGEMVGTASEDIRITNCYYMERAQNHTAIGNLPLYSAVKLKPAKMSSPEIFLEWDFGRTWTISDGYPKIWVRWDLTLIDAAGIGGAAKYSVDREHSSDKDGTIYTYTDRSGFNVTLSSAYKGSKITVYATDGDERTVLGTGRNGHVTMPSSLFTGSEIILYVEVFGTGPAPVTVIEEETAFIFIFAFIGFTMAVTTLNTIHARSIAAASARMEEEYDEEDEQPG